MSLKTLKIVLEPDPSQMGSDEYIDAVNQLLDQGVIDLVSVKIDAIMPFLAENGLTSKELSIPAHKLIFNIGVNETERTVLAVAGIVHRGGLAGWSIDPDTRPIFDQIVQAAGNCKTYVRCRESIPSPDGLIVGHMFLCQELRLLVEKGLSGIIIPASANLFDWDMGDLTEGLEVLVNVPFFCSKEESSSIGLKEAIGTLKQFGGQGGIIIRDESPEGVDLATWMEGIRIWAEEIFEGKKNLFK